MYLCIKSSINGDNKNIIFTRLNNIPNHDDGNNLSKKLKIFTTVSSLQLLITPYTNILNFISFNLLFSIHIITRKLIHLFILSTTSSHTLADPKNISNTLNTYIKENNFNPSKKTKFSCNTPQFVIYFRYSSNTKYK